MAVAMAMENGGVMMVSVDEEAADEVIEEVVFDSNNITFLLLNFFFARWSWAGSGFSNSSNSCMIV